MLLRRLPSACRRCRQPVTLADLPMACTFSAHGARWTVWPIGPGLNDALRTARKLSPMTGLYFQEADGEERLLLLEPADLAALGDLTSRSNQELAVLAERARVRS